MRWGAENHSAEYYGLRAKSEVILSTLNSPGKQFHQLLHAGGFQQMVIESGLVYLLIGAVLSRKGDSAMA